MDRSRSSLSTVDHSRDSRVELGNSRGSGSGYNSASFEESSPDLRRKNSPASSRKRGSAGGSPLEEPNRRGSLGIFGSSTPKVITLDGDDGMDGEEKGARILQLEGEVESLKKEVQDLTNKWNRSLRNKSCDQFCAMKEIIMTGLEEAFEGMTMIDKGELKDLRDSRLKKKNELDHVGYTLVRGEGEVIEALSNVG